MSELHWSLIVASVGLIVVNPATAATGRTQNQSSVTPTAFDFKGVRLGLSIEEFRNLPHPDGKAGRVVCTGDTVIENGRPALLGDLAVNRFEASLGIKKCAWWGSVYPPLPESEVSLSLPSEGYVVGVYSFDFIKDPKDGGMKFYKFFGTSHSNANSDVIAALTGKFGTPRKSVETMQNGFGASFQSANNTWANAKSVLTVKERWMTLNKLAIMLTDNRLLKIANDAEAAEKAKTKNAI